MSDQHTTDILIYSRTDLPHHPSIPVGVGALLQLSSRIGLRAVPTEDPSWFTREEARRIRGVILLNTACDGMSDGQRAGLQATVRSGGGIVAIHAASYFETEWEWYERMIGARFAGHPEPQIATVRVADPSHPATEHMPEAWSHFDEWYNFREVPRGVRILATVDEGSYKGGAHGAHHPVIWCHSFDGGRVFYTALGHTVECFTDEVYLDHVAGAIRWACEGGRVPG